MTQEEIKDKVSSIFSDEMQIDIEEVDVHDGIWHQQGIDELDILELFEALDEEFGTNLFEDRNIDLLNVSIEDIITLIERKVNN